MFSYARNNSPWAKSAVTENEIGMGSDNMTLTCMLH